MQFNYYVGIDVSKGTLDVAILHGEDLILERQIKNTRSGISGLLKHVSRITGEAKDILFCLEATGVYGRLVVEKLVSSCIKVWVVNPVHIKRSQGLVRGKSDRIDAVRIAQFANRNWKQARLHQPVRPEVEKMSILNRTREQLVKVRTQLRQSLTELRFYDNDLKDLKRSAVANSLEAISQDVKRIDKQIQDIIQSDEKLDRLYQIACSVDGIGPVTAVEIITATNEFQTINEAKKFACYAGVAPFPNSSGSSLKGKARVSHLANKRIKKLLHLGALSAIRYHGDLRLYYLRKVQEGKHKMSVLNAVRNKIVNRLFACIKQDKLYQRNLDLS